MNVLLALVLFFTACAGDSLFGPIGTNLADPIAIMIDAASNRAYVVNANLSVTYTEGSLIALDLATPTAPTLLNQTGNPASLTSLSGQAFLDAGSGQVFLTNRFSENRDDDIDTVYRVSVTEDATFGATTAFDSGEDPFGIACCDANNRFYVTAQGTVESYSLADPTDRVSRSLEVTLGDGEVLSGNATTRALILGAQLFLTNRSGRIYVLNTSEITNTSANPIDYLITGMNDLRGIATDGTRLYVVDVGEDDVNIVRVIDPSTLTAVDPDVAAVSEVGIETVELATVAVGADPNELVVLNDRVYVTNTEDNTVTAINISDPTAPTVATTIDLQAGGFAADAPFGLAAATLGGNDYLYVTNIDSHNLSIVDLATQSVTAAFP